MDYLFENLNDERFQEFCSALINKKYNNVQSFPVGQPDGGRDSVAYLFNVKKEFIIFQVKYVKNPKKLQDPHTWLVDIIQKEVEKIEKLIPRGAIQYILITNVCGTAHLDAGSIDKLNNVLESNIPIPSLCWWRDDLARLIEEDPIFKWNFPEILNGQDILNNILFQYVNKDQDRLKLIVNAYLADQYEIDSEVKFKQIDLQNKTLDLFVDVPIRAKKIDPKNKLVKRIIEKNLLDHQFHVEYQRITRSKDSFKNAAEFLLDSVVQENIERVLLEGGPGQGKSTISQFVCQVNRIKLLNKHADKLKLSPKFIESPVRFPIKIDLRHIASWVNKRNPYEGVISAAKFEEVNHLSLESFLQYHFIYHSKFDSVSVEDIYTIFRSSSILIVFDGFDEIADLKLRQEVIDFINRGINRINGNSISIQVIVTSRPAAFTENADFPISLYPRFELIDLNDEVTNEYVEKWTKVNKLDRRETINIKNLVKEKIKQAHIRELTKSPMQLAIFLSLLRTRGESLPNKRTALYDSYIELFFNREAEKNSVIREKRDLIINIHEYLGWLLHSEAESLQNNGIITVDELRSKLDKYLLSEGHDTSISGELFDVVKERVCALVSRTQGTFEFEVQPLREYFCAKYLYNTAPYSSAMTPSIRGTKPDIFKAIIRNVYWQNVTRFFAGCFDKGELPMLIFELKELAQESEFKNTAYVKLITSQLLSDWVFTQYPKLLTEVVKIIIDGISKGYLIIQDEQNLFSSTLSIPNECGRIEVIDRAFEQLQEFPKIDYARELINLINNNPESNYQRWLKIYDSLSDVNREKWLLYGYHMGVLHNLDSEFLQPFLNEEAILKNPKIFKYLINGNALKSSDYDENLKEIILTEVLENRLFLEERGARLHSSLLYINYLSLIFNRNYINFLLSESRSDTIFESLNRQVDLAKQEILDSVDTRIVDFLSLIDTFLNTKISELKNNDELWKQFFDSVSLFFKESSSSILLCITILKFNSKKEESFQDCDDLFDKSTSIYTRFKTAKNKHSNIRYWKNNLDKYKNSDKENLVMLFIAFASPKLIISLYDEINDILNNFDDVEFDSIMDKVSRLYTIKTFTKKNELDIKDWISDKKLTNRFLSILSFRFNEKNRHSFLLDHISLTEKFEVINSEMIVSLCVNLLKTNDTIYLEKIKNVYKDISNLNDPLEYFRYFTRLNEKDMSMNIAYSIMKTPVDYPQLLISMAEKKYFNHVCTEMVPVGKTAEENKWFDNSITI